MDYRERKYYLARFYNYNQSIYEIKNMIPSVKIHKPYNHFRNDKYKKLMKLNKFSSKKSIYDGDICQNYVQCMISCKLEDCEKLEKFLHEELKFVQSYTNIEELTKEICGQ